MFATLSLIAMAFSFYIPSSKFWLGEDWNYIKYSSLKY